MYCNSRWSFYSKYMLEVTALSSFLRIWLCLSLPRFGTEASHTPQPTNSTVIVLAKFLGSATIWWRQKPVLPQFFSTVTKDMFNQTNIKINEDGAMLSLLLPQVSLFLCLVILVFSTPQCCVWGFVYTSSFCLFCGICKKASSPGKINRIL